LFAERFLFMKRFSLISLVTGLLIFIIIFLAYCIEPSSAKEDLRGPGYAGAAECRQCHQEVYDSHSLTAHFKATSEAVPENIHGDFTRGNKQYQYDVNTKVEMQKRDSGYYFQVFNYGKPEDSYKLDIVFGWKNAQTYMYAKNNQTFELPLSYYHSVKQWGTSPGFPTVQPYFSRMVGRDCYECHSSYLDEQSTSIISSEQKFNSKNVILGIDCERCHGPAKAHAEYHVANPTEKKAKYLVMVSNLSRSQKIDACAVCHSGNDKSKIESRFYFKMGDTLGKFFMPKHYAPNESFDVHGNQYGLLSQSKCFLRSEKMTCFTCHSAHQDAIKDLAVYSQTCIACHQESHVKECPKKISMGKSIEENCVDCHMPKQASNAINFRLQNSTQFSSYILRSHRIMVYSDSIKNKKRI
jgi:hypothetical protein